MLVCAKRLLAVGQKAGISPYSPLPTIGESGKPEVAISDSSAIAPSHVSALSEARFDQALKLGEVLCARSIEPFVSRLRASTAFRSRQPFSFPDATLNASGPVTVNVQAQFIPVGTVPKVIVMSEIGPDQAVNCSPLAGTLQQSTCSASSHFQPVARVVL